LKKYSERQILNSKTPDQFIDRCVNSDLTRGQKILIGRSWREKTGHTIQDIEYARNRHPFWKAKKMSGWKTRNEKRWEQHDYTENGKQAPDHWTKNDYALLKEYIKTDKKNKRGLYKFKDREVAEKFATSIPSIQHLRRKTNMVTSIIEKEGITDNLKNRVDFMKRGETWLRKRLGK
jgi:hypothetical protein